MLIAIQAKFDTPINELITQDITMTRFLDSEHLDCRRSLSSPDAPYTLIRDRLLNPVQKRHREINTNISIPSTFSPSFDCSRDTRYINLLNLSQNPIVGAKPDDDLRDAEEEGLDPEFEEFAFESYKVAIALDLNTGFELDPVNARLGVRGSRLGIPNSIDFTADYHCGFANASADYGTILCLIADSFILAILDVVSRSLAPWGRQETQGLEFVAYNRSVEVLVCGSRRKSNVYPRNSSYPGRVCQAARPVVFALPKN